MTGLLRGGAEYAKISAEQFLDIDSVLEASLLGGLSTVPKKIWDKIRSWFHKDSKKDKNNIGKQISDGARKTADQANEIAQHEADEVERNRTDRIVSTSDAHISESGFSAICLVEDDSRLYVRDENGNVIGIRNTELGDGGYTIGHGTWIRYGDTAKIQSIIDRYGVDPRDPNAYLPIEAADELMREEALEKEQIVKKWALENGHENMTQQEFDGLVVQAYHAWHGEYAEAYLDPSKSDEDVVAEIMEGYAKYNTDQVMKENGKGWENRVRYTVQVIRHGDYTKRY